MSKEIIWQPSKELIENSKLTKFIQHCKLKNYDELEKKSFSDPGWLWDNVIKFSDLKFYKPYSKILDESKGTPWTRWCIGGKTNIVLNCIDRHKDKEFFKNTFILPKEKTGKKAQLLMKNLISKFQKLGIL